MANISQLVDQNSDLSNRMLAEINRGLSELDQVHAACDRAENCGNDMSQVRTEAEEKRQLLNAYKATYFPRAK